MMICECGLKLPQCTHHRHRNSLYHRRHRQIGALLSDSRISYAEVAKRFGISRERVRQIACQVGVLPGRKRSEQRTTIERWSAWRNRHGHREVIARCEKLGYAVEPSRREAIRGWRFESRIVMINGWRTHVGYMRSRGRNLILKRAGILAEFYVRISPIGLFVFPSEVWRTLPSLTEFSANQHRTTRRMSVGNRRDYLSYLEAWKGLNAKRQQSA